ncbi:MAG: GerAB/ArcD/ProY family transporter [Lachnospiraceae bacterium]|nr:GerAB/ArcD/ProY family transporter [Lachnospiraceae bacterium]
MESKCKISLRQLQALAIVDIFGISAISLPLGVCLRAAQMGWVWVLVGSIGVIILACMALSIKNPDKLMFSTPIGGMVSILISGKILLTTGIWLRIFSETINVLLLQKTPTLLVSTLLALLCLYVAVKGVEARARMAEIIFIGTVFILVTIFALTSTNIDFYKLLPITANGGMKATAYVFSSAFGIEFLLYIKTFLNTNKKNEKSIVTAGLFIGLTLSIITALTLGVFGADGVIKRRWAVLQIMDTIDFPLMLLERQDLLMTGFWISSAFAFINAGIFYSGLILSETALKKRCDKFLYFIVAIIVVVVSALPEDITAATALMEKSKVLNLGTYVVIFVMFLADRLVKKVE